MLSCSENPVMVMETKIDVWSKRKSAPLSEEGWSHNKSTKGIILSGIYQVGMLFGNVLRRHCRWTDRTSWLVQLDQMRTSQRDGGSGLL